MLYQMHVSNLQGLDCESADMKKANLALYYNIQKMGGSLKNKQEGLYKTLWDIFYENAKTFRIKNQNIKKLS